VDAALHASALQHQPSLLPQGPLNFLSQHLRLNPNLNLDSPHPRHQPLSHLQPTLIQISNHNRRSAGRMRRQQTHHPDRPRATNHQWIPQSESRPLDPRQSDRKRLQHRAFFEIHAVWEFVQPGGGVGVVATQSTVYRRRGEEGHVWATMVLAGAAGRAGRLGTGDAVLKGYAVAWEYFRLASRFLFSNSWCCLVRYIVEGFRGHCIGWARDSVQALERTRTEGSKKEKK
jgi:hypothetical protein